MDTVQTGGNLKQIKKQNLALVLRHVTLGFAKTRAELARSTGLSKMAVSNLVADLLKQNILEETEFPVSAYSPGRPPVGLCISSQAPLLCGMLIKRGYCQVVLTDLSGKVLEQEAFDYGETLTAEGLVSTLRQGFDTVQGRSKRSILGVGIACIGPLNAVTGEILEPADFYGITHLPIVEKIREHTQLPTYLINDATAGALAERFFGFGRTQEDFAYLHIMNGVGAGLCLGGSVVGGDLGQSGEIGHTTINFAGPQCACGKKGCLDVYANIRTMRQTAKGLAPLHPASPLNQTEKPRWIDFMQAAQQDDPLALSVLQEFCEYLHYALSNFLSITGVSAVVLGYPAPEGFRMLEDLLEQKLRCFDRSVRFHHSAFLDDAPLIGAAALVADKIFRCELEL